MAAKYLRNFEDKYLDLMILFFFPILQVLINSNWIFNPIKALPLLAFRDTWFYNGIFFFFFDYVKEGFMSRHYFVERLPSNIPGYYLYHLLSPLKANYILHLGYYYIAVFSIYFILCSLLNKRSALITSLAMGSYPWFLRAVGWDYVDGVGIAYYCLSIAFLVAATWQHRSRLLLFGAGITVACLIFTNLFWFPFVLILLMFYFVFKFVTQKHNTILDVLFFCTGGLTITVFFGLFYYFAAGRYIFFENSIRAALNISKDSGLTPLLKLMYATMEPYWLILPILFLCSAGLLLVTRKMNLNHRPYPIHTILLLQFFLTFGFFAFWHVFFQPYLFIFLYASYLIPSTFLLFGSLISNSLENLTSQQYYIATMLCVVVLIAPLALTSSLFEILNRLQANLVLLTVTGLALVISFFIKNRFSIVFSCAAVAAIGFIGGADANVYIQDRWKARDGFVAVTEAVKEINKIRFDNHRNLALLYDDSKLDVPGGALQAIYANMPGLGYEQVRPVGWEIITPFNKSDVLLISQTGTAYKNIEQYFSQYPDTVSLDLKKRILVRGGNFKFYLFLFHINFQELDHLYRGEIFEFDRPFKGKNFYPFELAQGQSFVWSGPETEADVYLKLGPLNEDANLSLCIYALQPEILDSFKLYVNNVSVPIIRSSEADCSSLFKSVIPKTIISKNSMDITTFAFRINKTISPLELGINTDARKLGLRFDWIKIE